MLLSRAVVTCLLAIFLVIHVLKLLHTSEHVLFECCFMIFYRLRGKRLCFVRFLVYKINTYCSFIWSCRRTKHWPVVTLKKTVVKNRVIEPRPGPIRHWSRPYNVGSAQSYQTRPGKPRQCLVAFCRLWNIDWPWPDNVGNDQQELKDAAAAAWFSVKLYILALRSCWSCW